MQDFKIRIKQAWRYFKQNTFTSQNFFFAAVVFIVVTSIVGGLSSMNRNWRLEQKLEDARVTQRKLELEIDKLKYENSYYNSDEYQELIAREKLDKKYPGETMVILPKNSKVAKEKDKQTKIATLERKKTNLEIWLDFLF